MLTKLENDGFLKWQNRH